MLKHTQTKILLITQEIQSEILGSKFLPEEMQELHRLIKVRLWIHLLSVNFNSYCLFYAPNCCLQMR